MKVILCLCFLLAVSASVPTRKHMVRLFGDTEVQQIHINYAGQDAEGNPNGMVVSWNTASATATSTVMYGLASGKYTDNAVGTQNTYFDSYNHHVVLENLLPNTTYYFVCGDQAGGFSNESSFVTAITKPRPFVLNVYGDMGLTDGDGTRAQLIKQLSDVDFIWHVGDMSYADDDVIGWDYEKVWDLFMNSIEPISSTRPYMVLPGNHEAECHFLGCLPGSDNFYKLRNFTAYRNRFRMPWPESGGSDNMWYSFNFGQAHFVSISTETDFPGSPEGQGSLANDGPFGDQLAWLEADLAAADAQRALRPWVFVAGHRPIYSGGCATNNQPNGDCAKLQAAIEDLMNKYHVDIYFCGHVHSYERIVPVYKGVPTAGAPLYIVQGAAGNVEGHSNPGAHDWQAFVDNSNFGYGRLTIYNETSLHWGFYRDSDNALIDELSWHKAAVGFDAPMETPTISIA